MNPTQARDLIKDTFTQAFDKAKFREFAGELLNHVDGEKAFTRNAQYVKEAFRDHVSRFERLGTYTSPEDEKLDVLIVHLTAGSKLERARTALRNFVADHLKERENKDAALVAFVSPGEKQWRFSFVKMEYAAIAKESGKVGVETRFTPARRFSYLVGEGESCHTAQTRFIGLLQETSVDPTLEKLEEAFSVEAVTKEFYREISNWYFWTRECPGVFFPKDVESAEQRALFLIRLLTRLIFCWFLREKKNPQTGSGLIPGALFDVRHIRDLLKDPSPESCTYYTAILQNLFFATLNTEMDQPGKKPERRFIDEGDGQRSDEHMVHQLWRHERQLKDPAALEKLLRGIPFLNGGLFECLDDRIQKKNTPYTVEVRYDGFASDPKKQPKLPNFLFFGASQEVDLSEIYGDASRRRETVSPLLDILGRYNFTLTENTPLDQEVALDPELLGHVFENMLAAYNPETGIVARKATGSFYTPRVVVDWMADQALLVYLKEALESSPSLQLENQLKSHKQDACATPFFDPRAEVCVARRNLPHWCQKGVMYFVTFRLADSLPDEKLLQLQRDREAWDKAHTGTDKEMAEFHRLFSDRVEQWLDSGSGSCCLAHPDVADIVADALRHFDGDRYILDEWVVMPNHVHVLVTPLATHSLSDILHSWKSFTATAINKALRQSGQLWQHESYDHIVRSEWQLQHFRRYIRENPEKSGIKVAQASSLDAKDGSVTQSSSLRNSARLQHSASKDACATLADTVEQASGLFSSGSFASNNSCVTLDKRLRRLFSWEEEDHDFTLAEVEKLIDAIDNLKALDPACGSGAFPMGLLQKLVHVLNKLDPQNKGWRKRQEAAAERIESGPTREEALKAIRRAFAHDNDDYGRKLYLIENCLYGVDIQPIAVQIAKLRFFISLVVDQAIDPKEENYGILPLPNLETKIVAANTLLGLHRGQLLLGSNEVKRLETELQKVRHDYFTARSYKRKKELRKEDKRLCEELAVALESSGECTPYDAKRLSEWNPYDTSKHAPFFDPGWMFGLSANKQCSANEQSSSIFQLEMKNHTSKDACATLSGGPFDIVIGNPPYVRQEELKNQTVIGSDGREKPLKDTLKGQYECFTGTADLYVYFFERSLQLLHIGGVLSFITSNKYFRAAYGERLRSYLSFATNPGVVLDFGDAPVFTSIAYPAIIVTQKTRSVELGQLPKNVEQASCLSGNVAQASSLPDSVDQASCLQQPQNQAGSLSYPVRVMTWTPGPNIGEFPAIFESNAFNLARRDLKPDGWRMESPVNLRLLEKLRKAGPPLREFVGVRVFRGITTGFNEAFTVDATTYKRLIEEHKSSSELLKPYLRGRDVDRWHCESQDSWLIFTRRGVDITKYPAIHAYLKQFKKRLTPGVSAGRKPGNYEWYEIQDNTAYWTEFEKPKVISTKISIRPTFAVDMDGFFLGNTSYFMPTGRQTLYISALLNSSLFYGYAKRVFVQKQGGWYEVQPEGLEQFPIPPATPQQKSELEKIVEKILSTKKANPSADVSSLESEIDRMVYRLYGLTGEEIRIVEGNERMVTNNSEN